MDIKLYGYRAAILFYSSMALLWISSSTAWVISDLKVIWFQEATVGRTERGRARRAAWAATCLSATTSCRTTRWCASSFSLSMRPAPRERRWGTSHMDTLTNSFPAQTYAHARTHSTTNTKWTYLYAQETQLFTWGCVKVPAWVQNETFGKQHFLAGRQAAMACLLVWAQHCCAVAGSLILKWGQWPNFCTFCPKTKTLHTKSQSSWR